MIKTFSKFNEESTTKIYEGSEHLVSSMDIIPGTDDYQIVTKFIKEMCNGKVPPASKTNILQLVNFCVNNYFGFNYPEEKGPLKTSVDKIKESIKVFFRDTELEQDWGTSVEGENYAVDAVFRNTRKGAGWGRGLLQRFFDVFWYIRSNSTEDQEGLDARATSLIREIIQEIKETWDPPGMDAYYPKWLLGAGDSDAIKHWNKVFLAAYGSYALDHARLMKEKNGKLSQTFAKTYQKLDSLDSRINNINNLVSTAEDPTKTARASKPVIKSGDYAYDKSKKVSLK
jgi:hypothetical protein